jgi:hypothetical protein
VSKSVGAFIKVGLILATSAALWSEKAAAQSSYLLLQLERKAQQNGKAITYILHGGSSFFGSARSVCVCPKVHFHGQCANLRQMFYRSS